MSKRKYSSNWENKDEFRGWLQKTANGLPMCKWCDRKFKTNYSFSLFRHTKTEKRKQFFKQYLANENAKNFIEPEQARPVDNSNSDISIVTNSSLPQIKQINICDEDVGELDHNYGQTSSTETEPEQANKRSQTEPEQARPVDNSNSDNSIITISNLPQSKQINICDEDVGELDHNYCQKSSTETELQRKYNPDWENDEILHDWLKQGDNGFPLCTVCDKPFGVNHLYTLHRHATTENHKKNLLKLHHNIIFKQFNIIDENDHENHDENHLKDSNISLCAEKNNEPA
ncbi:hypothetical protein TKK_0012431 [Trichogramma kaykai]